MIANLPANNTAGVPSDQWSVAGGGKVGAINTNDDDTQYIFDGTNGHKQCYNVTWPTDVGAVNSIKIFERVRQTGPDAIHIAGGVRNAGGETNYDPGVLPTNYTNYTSGALARPGGGTWGTADCNNGVTYMQFSLGSGGAGNGRATWGYLILDYEPPGGGFAFLIVSLVGAMLGANLALADMPGIAREVARDRISIIQPHEYERALAELRAHPFRVWSR